jgi:hypothetical protein
LGKQKVTGITIGAGVDDLNGVNTLSMADKEHGQRKRPGASWKVVRTSVKSAFWGFLERRGSYDLVNIIGIFGRKLKGGAKMKTPGSAT